jgi:hypothetical protein
MNYIINPWVFYLLNIIGHIVVWSIAGLIIFGSCYAVYLLIWFVEISGSNYEDKYPSPIALIRKWKIPLILCITALILIPSEETCYKMLIASQVTTEHIADAKETIREVADYIVESAKEIKGDVE